MDLRRGVVNGTGNALANVLTGNAAANTLDGGAGADTMVGGDGDDTYVIDTAGDKAVEAAEAGTDMVNSTVTFTLGANVENLTLIGSASIDGIGNALANIIIGNTGKNTLNGGTGADTLSGGKGWDTYVIDNAGDVVVENENGGIDTVRSTVEYTLPDNVENLTILGRSIDATGNGLANVLTGNSESNTLDGGAGADTMIGGKGWDLYVVDDGGDVVWEYINGNSRAWAVERRQLWRRSFRGRAACR